MAIQSASEFEAVVNNAVIAIEKAIQETGTNDRLAVVRDDLARIGAAARTGSKLKALRAKLEDVADTVQVQIPSNDKLLNDLWDLLDYVDYRA